MKINFKVSCVIALITIVGGLSACGGSGSEQVDVDNTEALSWDSGDWGSVTWN